MNFKTQHLSHKGKVTDKWASYLEAYNDIFEPFKDNAKYILEIGVQNGGSLEVLSEYFSNFERLVGCDINENCKKLTYENSKISVVVGDANSEEVANIIKSYSTVYDIIIDDGSHTSSDIIKSFLSYFPLLAPGGIFIVEDLHCSYWQEFQGGLYDENSSMGFLKSLTDLVNFEHWGVNTSREEYLSEFSNRLNTRISEKQLAQIHSIHFINSICVIKKKDENLNTLGSRLISGDDAIVEPSILELLERNDTKLSVPIQEKNYWSNSLNKPSNQILRFKDHLSRQGIVFSSLEETYERQESLIRTQEVILSHATSDISKLKLEIESLRQSVSEYIDTVQNRDQFINNMRSSTSWRITFPLRQIKRLLARIFF